MPKYPTKIPFWLSFFLLFLIAATLAANVYLSLSKNKIAQNILQDFTHEVSICSLFYVFPDEVILKNVVLRERFSHSPTLNTLLVVPKLVLKFSLRELFVRQHFSAKAIAVTQPDIKFRQLINFLQENSRDILRIINQLPLNDIQVRIKDVSLDFNPNDKTDNAHIDFALNVKGKNVMANGLVRPTRDPDNPMQFRLRGHVKPGEGLFFSDLVFQRPDFSGKFWGNFSSGRLQLNGFSLWDTAVKPKGWKNSLAKNQRLRSFFHKKAQNEQGFDPTIYILDIGCRVKNDFPKTEIEAFVFSINGISIASQRSEQSIYRDNVASGTSHVTSPLPAKILQVFVKSGAKVQYNQKLIVLESMKMEIEIRSPRDGTINSVTVKSGDQVTQGFELLTWANNDK